MTMDSVYNPQHKYQPQPHNSAQPPQLAASQLQHHLQHQTQPLPSQPHHHMHHLHPSQPPLPPPPPPSQQQQQQQLPQQIHRNLFGHNHDHSHNTRNHHHHHHHHHHHSHQQTIHNRQPPIQQQLPLVYHPTYPTGPDAISTIPVEASLRPVESIQHIDDCTIQPTDYDQVDKIIQAILDARKALEKQIEQRDDRDIHLIDNLCSLVRGFDVFPKTARRALAEHAVLAVIDGTGKELIVHNEELDSYCVLIYGVCEQLDVTKSQTVRIYHVGDAFGVCEPTTDVIRFEGYMRTLWENCAFLCVKRDDFYAILTDPANFPSKEVVRHRDKNGNIFCISNLDLIKKSTGPIWSFNLQADGPFKLNLPDGHIIVKATEECLLMALVNGYDTIDTDYVDDFLIVFRVFLSLDQLDKEKGLPPGMTKLCSSLTSWLDYEPYRDKVIKIVLTWLSSYYQDFELNCDFSYLFFRELESKLVHLSMNDQLHLLHVTLSTKSKVRNVTISRSSREQPLPFVISGGYDKNCGIFVKQVYFASSICEGNYVNSQQSVGFPRLQQTSVYQMPNARARGSTARYPPLIPRVQTSTTDNRYSGSLRPGDQILEVNGTNFTAIKLSEAQRKLDISTHLSLTVKYNPSAFYEMRALPEGRRKSSSSSISMTGMPSVSPYHSSNSQSKFSFNAQDLLFKSNNDGFPPASPLFSANSNFGFSSLVKTTQKHDKYQGESKFKLSSLINSSKQIVKQFVRDSAMPTNSELKNLDQLSESSSISNGLENVASNKARSNPDLANARQKFNGNFEHTPLTDLNTQMDATAIGESSAFKADQSLVNVLRVFNAANNESRYILVHEETTAREAVMVAVKEFNLSVNSSSQQHSYNGDRSSSSLDWHLYEVSVVSESRTIKQKRLSEQTTRLAERAPLCSRFYIKNNSQTSINGSTRLDSGDDTLVTEILKESPPTITLTSLNATLLAVELTLVDFDKFKGIEPQQFVYDTFFDYSDKQKKSPNGNNSDSSSLKSSSSEGQEIDPLSVLNKTRTIPKEWMTEYQAFADISNKEMFWVICEILNERNIGRRVKIVKQFVRVADVCLQLRNYNSMFAIISGLGHSCVSRLRRSFDKLKPKYKNQLEKMRMLFDPSRNMASYRLRLSQTPPPAIPLFPQIKKDLTFTKEGRSIFVREPNNVSDDEDDDFGQQNSRQVGLGSMVSPCRSSSLDNNSRAGGLRDSILINFAEIRQFTDRVSNVTRFSSVPYSNDLLTNNKENQRNQAQIKKMYEEWQMRKRIRHYLNETLDSIARGSDQTDSCSKSNNRLEITYDERILHSRSLEVEADVNPSHFIRPPIAAERLHQQQQRQQQSLQHQQHQLQNQQIQSAPQASMLAPSSGSPSLSESSSLQSLPYPGVQQISDCRLANDQKRGISLVQKVRGFDRFVYDTLAGGGDAHFQAPLHHQASSLSLDQQQGTHSAVPFASPTFQASHVLSASHYTRGKFGTENSEHLRKLTALSEDARHRAKPLG